MAERVLITGARAPAALDLARCFIAAGIETHMADCTPCNMARSARGIAQVHRYPAPRGNAHAFAQAIAHLTAQIGAQLVIPACEEVFHLAAAKAGHLYAPPLDTLRRLHSKQLFADACAGLGLPAPQTARLISTQDLVAYRGEAHAHVFKPEYSRFGTRAVVGPDARTLSEITPTTANPWVAQRRIAGTEVSFYAASTASRLVAFSAYRSAWRLRGGAGYAFEPVEPALFDRLREIASTLANKLIPQGQFACDVMVDEAGVPWLIECNPRATSGVFMFNRSSDLALAMLGRREQPVLGGGSLNHVGPALWLQGLPEALTRGQLKQWFAHRRAGRDVVSAPGDRAPVFGALIDTMAFGAKALAKGQGLAEVMTADIEWNGEEL